MNQTTLPTRKLRTGAVAQQKGKTSRLYQLNSVLAGLVVAATVAAMIGVIGPSATQASAASSVGGPITRSEVVARASYWTTHPPPGGYNMNGSFTDGAGKTYRTDCSGFASMALHLASSPSTAGLGTSTYTTPIGKSDLKAGDLLNIPISGSSGHVRIFLSWTDSSMTRYNFVDFGSGTKPAYKVSTGYPDAKNGNPYQPRRYKNIIDDIPSSSSGGTRVGFVNSDGALRIKEGPLNAVWTTVASGGVSTFDMDGTRVAALMSNGDLLVKEGPLNATWTTVAKSVTDFDLEGTRIAVRGTTGAISVKEGSLNATWTSVGNGAAVKLEGNRLAVRSNTGTLSVKEGPLNATWTTVANAVSDFDLEGTRIAVRGTTGTLSVKEGPLNATWTTVANAVTDFDLEGTRIAVRGTTGTISVKEGPLNATWTSVGNGAAVKLEGNRLAVRSNTGALSVKEGPLNATWTTVAASGVTNFDLSD